MGMVCKGARSNEKEDVESDIPAAQSPDTLLFLQSCLMDSPLLGGAEQACRELVANEISPLLERRLVEVGELLIVQGEKGDAMYIVEDGKLEIFKENKETCSYITITDVKRGQSIGVSAVLYKLPRSASVKALTPSTVWRLDLDLFNECREMIQDFEKEKAATIARDLRLLFEPFSMLDGHQIANISNAFEKITFPPDEQIYAAGADTDFYLIAEGEVEVVRNMDLQAELSVDTGFRFEGLALDGSFGSNYGSDFNLNLGSIMQSEQSAGSGFFPGVGSSLALTSMTPTVDDADYVKPGKLTDSREASTMNAFGGLTKSAAFYWCTQLPMYIDNDTSATIGKVTSRTKVVLYKLQGIDVKHLIVPYICPDLSSDHVSFEPVNNWEPSVGLESLSDFITIGVLGNGSFGAVTMIQDPGTQKTYACKKMFKDRIMEGDMQGKVLKAKLIMQSLHSPFIITLCGTYMTETALCFIMEVALGGEFWTLLETRGKLKEEDARFYSANITLALEELHKQDFLYRDLKPENLVLNARGYLMITDFDMTKKRDNRVTLCGTPEYMAPELIRQWAQGYGVDWWALGIIMYEMIFGHTPFRDTVDNPAHVKILNDNIEFPHHNPLSRGACDFISQLLQKVPYRRLGHHGSEQVREHIFFGRHSGFDPLDWDLIEGQTISPPFVPELEGNTDLAYFSRPDHVFDDKQYASLRHPPESYTWAEHF